MNNNNNDNDNNYNNTSPYNYYSTHLFCPECFTIV